MPRWNIHTFSVISSVILMVPIVVTFIRIAKHGTLNCDIDSRLDDSGPRGQQRFTAGYFTEPIDKGMINSTYKLKIICFGYNRPKSLRRLLESLNKADYDHDKVTLAVWLDRGLNGALNETMHKTAKSFTFKHGHYFVNIHDKHIGLLGQWSNTYNIDQISENEIVVFLEDDMTVLPNFYKYLKLVHSKYHLRPEINGYSLLGTRTKVLNEIFGNSDDPSLNQPVFKMQGLGTGGFSPNIPNWRRFLSWYNEQKPNQSTPPYPGDYFFTKWLHDMLRRNSDDEMFSLWHTYYTWSNKEYTLSCNFPDLHGQAIHWHNEGLHPPAPHTTAQDKDWTLSYDMLPDDPIVIDIPRDFSQ